MVSNGEKLQCSILCSSISVTLGNTEFLIDFYVLPISRAHVVLDIQWFKTLGPIVMHNAKLPMQFHWKRSQISLQGIRNNQVSEISSTQLKLMHATNSISEFYNLELSLTSQDSTDLTCKSPLINPLLNQFK